MDEFGTGGKIVAVIMVFVAIVLFLLIAFGPTLWANDWDFRCLFSKCVRVIEK